MLENSTKERATMIKKILATIKNLIYVEQPIKLSEHFHIIEEETWEGILIRLIPKENEE